MVTDTQLSTDIAGRSLVQRGKLTWQIKTAEEEPEEAQQLMGRSPGSHLAGCLSKYESHISVSEYKLHVMLIVGYLPRHHSNSVSRMKTEISQGLALH